MTIILTPQSKAFYVRNTMILDSFLRGLHSDRKLDFKCILLTSDRRQRLNTKLAQLELLYTALTLPSTHASNQDGLNHITTTLKVPIR